MLLLPTRRLMGIADQRCDVVTLLSDRSNSVPICWWICLLSCLSRSTVCSRRKSRGMVSRFCIARSTSSSSLLLHVKLPQAIVVVRGDVLHIPKQIVMKEIRET